MSPSRVNFTTSIDHKLLDEVRALAKDEGLPIQVVIEEALTSLIESWHRGKVRLPTMRAERTSHDRFGPGYKKLAF